MDEWKKDYMKRVRAEVRTWPRQNGKTLMRHAMEMEIFRLTLPENISRARRDAKFQSLLRKCGL